MLGLAILIGTRPSRAREQKLAARHLRVGGLLLYDLSSSYFEGSCCPLATRGYSRDGKKGKLQVNSQLEGCPRTGFARKLVGERRTTEGQTRSRRPDSAQAR